MRTDIRLLGPRLAARGKARVFLPGGWAIGDRPGDTYICGLPALGSGIERVKAI